jgi:hypothetical protein
MTLLAASYHARVVALGGIAKRKGVSSRANLLNFVKVFVGNIATTGHHAREVSPNWLLERKSNKEIRIKGMNGLGNICIQDRCISPSTKVPTGKPCISLLSLHPLLGHPLSTSSINMTWI